MLRNNILLEIFVEFTVARIAKPLGQCLRFFFWHFSFPDFRSNEEELLKPDGLNGTIVSQSNKSPEKHENDDPTAEESLLDEKNDQNETEPSTGKGVFHQV